MYIEHEPSFVAPLMLHISKIEWEHPSPISKEEIERIRRESREEYENDMKGIRKRKRKASKEVQRMYEEMRKTYEEKMLELQRNSPYEEIPKQNISLYARKSTANTSSFWITTTTTHSQRLIGKY